MATDARATSPDPTVEARQDLSRLLAFAAGQQGIQLSRELIADVVAVTRAAELTPELEERLWRAFDQLTRLIEPANAQSIRITSELAVDERLRPSLWRRRVHDAPARRVVAWARRWAFGTLFVVVFLQIFTLFGTRLVDEIEQIGHETRELATQLDLMASLPDGADTRARDRLDRQLEEVASRHQAAIALLRAWGRIPVAGMAPSAKSLRRPNPVTEDATVLKARMILQALALHVLPVLYGLLGASAFILRRIARQLTTSTFEATSISRYRIRQGLGVVLGLAMGVLPWNVGAVEAQLSLSAIALAFLAGYNVDVVFMILDRWLERMTAAAPSQAPVAPAASNAAPTTSAVATSAGTPTAPVTPPPAATGSAPAQPAPAPPVAALPTPASAP